MAETGTRARRRIESIDVVRGVIMIVMALDHVRDFFGVPGISPTDPVRASTALFFTRWATNFCAPVFFLLTGTGACLVLRRMPVGALSRFLRPDDVSAVSVVRGRETTPDGSVASVFLTPSGSGFKVQGAGFVRGSGFWVLGSGFWVLGSGCWVLGSGF